MSYPVVYQRFVNLLKRRLDEGLAEQRKKDTAILHANQASQSSVILPSEVDNSVNIPPAVISPASNTPFQMEEPPRQVYQYQSPSTASPTESPTRLWYRSTEPPENNAPKILYWTPAPKLPSKATKVMVVEQPATTSTITPSVLVAFKPMIAGKSDSSSVVNNSTSVSQFFQSLQDDFAAVWLLLSVIILLLLVLIVQFSLVLFKLKPRVEQLNDYIKMNNLNQEASAPNEEGHSLIGE